MITRILAFFLLGLLGPMQAALAKECLLSHATYQEPRSGAVVQFRPLANEPAALTAEVFSLAVPKAGTSLPADITWTNGKNSFPLGTIRHACTDDDREGGLQDGSGLCRLWEGQVYALTGGGAEQLNSREATPAPRGLLLPGFGVAFTEGADFANANPGGSAWDAFILTGCSDE
ncbi:MULTISPECIES: hypothetical protein [Mesorhizobium]|uniref:Uncharacterized protein n=2 Tax=Mesorhizobium TaxID=68287 RepID=E8TF77_MESCW|nr:MULTISPECIES: hypothetical protein [Mesorhizobium]RUZ87834.1 hypothetical protein EN947_09570 [Mesorhizobium sp. M7A.F.Ca.US.003.02.2.1]ADV13417.1 hypothetical protein Mesci_4307 [Mesorhizobium ciceri biovar biserrulae WSM1271]AMX92601.1 hypothetical protein A4R28_05530 [Mesorhizobium ciceri]MBZ9718011.1 hypothetical protein [Mesorhizobium sp. AD1-1]MDF3211273.1 hypothetical protein [Mesorhizobium sp. LMG15046]